MNAATMARPTQAGFIYAHVLAPVGEGRDDTSFWDPHRAAASKGQFLRIAGRWINNQLFC
jgi:hypothetical protein